MFNKLKQFKDLKSQAKDLQNTLSQETITGTGQWDKIKITMNGNLEVTEVQINPELLNSESQSKLQDGIKEATNNAIKKAQKIMAEKVKSGDIDMSAFGM